MKSPAPLPALAVLLAALALAAPAARADDQPAYRTLTPVVSAEFSNLTDAARHLRDGLSGIGQEMSVADCKRHISDFVYLPDLDEVDPLKPVRYFLLAQNPPAALPDPAIVLPIVPDGAKGLIRSLRQRYAVVEGGSIKICSEPLDGKAIEPLYIAIAEGNALISPNVDAIRWLAYHLQAKTLPKPPVFRDAPLRLSANGPLLGLFLELVASLDADAVSERATADNLLLHIRELGVFAASFQRIDFAVDASLTQWDISARLAPAPGGTLAETIHALPPPADSWMDFFPPFASNRAASEFPAFVAALPPSNRRWLASLAENTRLLGFGIVPSAFDLDERLRPHLSGTGFSTFVAAKPTGRFGSISIAGLKSPADARAALRDYFSAKGPASKNPRIRSVDSRGEGRVIVYDISAAAPAGTASSIGHVGEAVSQLLSLHHVEIAVKGDYLVIARGPSGLIDLWLDGRRVSPWAEKSAALTGAFPDHSGETVLGGGSAEPVALARRIIQGTPDLAYLLERMPHAGSGLAWRMARSGGDAVFDLRLYDNELLACDLLRGTESSAMQEFLSQLVMRYFQRSADAESRQQHLRDKLNELRDK